MGIYGAWQGYKEARELGRQRKASSIDALVKQAELQEAGYNIKPGLFGSTLQRTPGYVSPKMEKEQLQMENLRRQNRLYQSEAILNELKQQEIDRLNRGNNQPIPQQPIMTQPQQFGGQQNNMQTQQFGTPQNNQQVPIQQAQQQSSQPRPIPQQQPQQFGGQEYPIFTGQKYEYDPISDTRKETDEYKLWMVGQEENAKKSESREKESEMIRQSAQEMLNAINEVRNGIKYFGATGPIPTMNPFNYDRKNWEANTQRILAQKIIDLMMRMKQASSTGATGFGQLSDKERILLKEASTALNRGLSPIDAVRYLDEMEGPLSKVYYGDQYTDVGGGMRPGKLIVVGDGVWRVVGGDPQDPEIERAI